MFCPLMGSCPLQKAQQLSREGYKQKPVLKPVSRSIRLQEKNTGFDSLALCHFVNNLLARIRNRTPAVI